MLKDKKYHNIITKKEVVQLIRKMKQNKNGYPIELLTRELDTFWYYVLCIKTDTIFYDDVQEIAKYNISISRDNNSFMCFM